MKKLIGLVAIGALIAGPAMAADMNMPLKAPPAPIAPVPSWTGFYIGADVGGVWARDVVSPTVADGGVFPRSNTLNPSGVFGGGTLGYNWQINNFLLGVEGDVGGMGISSSKADLGTGTEVDFLSTGVYGDVTGRVGVIWNQALFYFKGGWAAFGGHATTTTGVAGFASTNSPAFTAGWTAGGGVEYMLTPQWSVKVEYLHFDFGTENAALTGVCCGAAPGPFPYANKLTADSVKAGVNYHFNWGGPIATRY